MNTVRWILWRCGIASRADVEFLTGIITKLCSRVDHLESKFEYRNRFENAAHIDDCIAMDRLRTQVNRIAMKLALNDITEEIK